MYVASPAVGFQGVGTELHLKIQGRPLVLGTVLSVQPAGTLARSLLF